MAFSSNHPSLVLVAKDEELVRLYAADLLTDAGFEVIELAPVL
jgi:hypothetical protein